MQQSTTTAAKSVSTIIRLLEKIGSLHVDQTYSEFVPVMPESGAVGGILLCIARPSKIRWMRDGIYSFDIRSDEWVTNGIVLVENNAIRGFNSNHVYMVERTINSGRTRWHVSEIRYVSHTQGFSMLGFPATLDGEEGLDWFRLEGESDADVNVKIEIQGRRQCDLPWPRADKSLDRSDA